MDKMNISLLYVEDDGTLRNIYQKILKYSIEKVYVASDGLEGLETKDWKNIKPTILTLY